MYNYNEDKERIIVQADRIAQTDKNILTAILNIFNDEHVNALDFGCGDGYVTMSRYKEFNNISVTAIDTDRAAIDKVEKNELSNFIFLHHNILIENLDNKFKLISLFNTLQHIKNPQRILKILWDKLDIGGCLLIRVPDDNYKIEYPQHKVFDYLINFYSTISNSDRYIGSKIVELTSKLTQVNKREVLFINECTINMTKEERKYFFKDIFDFRISNLKKMNLLNDQIIEEIVEYEKKFINEENYYFSNTQCIYKIWK